MPVYYTIHKPYQVLSQFSPQDGKQTLKDYYNFPGDAYPVGRLDYDSEGLLIITNDTSLNHKLLNPAFGHEREYWVQVDGQVTQQAIDKLQAGLTINIDGREHKTLPCLASVFTELPAVSDRNPPVRYRKHIPTSWITLTLTEGKNRQVRKMTAAAGFPTLRLIRHRIGKLDLGAIAPGAYVEWQRNEIYALLGLR